MIRKNWGLREIGEKTRKCTQFFVCFYTLFPFVVFTQPFTAVKQPPQFFPFPGFWTVEGRKKVRKMKQWRIVLGLLGGICIHLVIGTSYIAGNISVYLVSYLRLQGEDVTLEDAVILLPLTFVGITITLFIGAKLSLRLGPRLTTLIGNSIVVLATFCGSFCTSFWSFCLVYSLLFGLGDGISYMSPLIMGWSYYPQHKGRISGLILTFFAMGTSIFGPVSTAIINPDNKSANIKVKNGATTDHYYSADVANGFPAMMRWLSLCYLCLSIIGVALLAPVNPPSKQDEQHYTVEDDMIRLPSVKEGFKHKKFWLLFVMGLLSSSNVHTGFGMYLAAAYKDFGSDKIDDDAFLAAVGSISFFMNGIFRIIFAQLMDYSSFKLIYGILVAVQVRTPVR